MLKTNQWLDKLAAMHTDFISRGMLPGGHASGRTHSHLFPRGDDNESDDEGPADEDVVLGNVVLACARGMMLLLFLMGDL